ncbi:acyl-CoA dehydrogenase family protein [Amycolatopsis australiensis]|uniref:Acyl-CoA dehydrogenase, C-terminal domain n=1 Tax=Amycolatopsis australiensis TaxID=546364 RepID=A0A1K1SBD9_9PSEU|nr:acyl-CoA dehydrogenase family protein [Amycolatopsis australiensis]SFW81412.1 Acyl-CoA dehydrogenase, C-terminal domain [Amycolatopsis australiensis]
MTALATAAPTLAERTARVADVLAEHAREVDDSATFPVASLDALRESGLMGLLVPVEHGGLGGDLADLARTAAELGGACLSTAMIWAMHGQQVAAIAAHAGPRLRADLLPRIARGEVYVASVTSERGKGGHLLTAEAPLRPEGDRLRIERDAPIVTGGAVADGFLVTMRASPEAGHDDVSLVYADRGQLTATPGRGGWNPMGMRGTHSVPLRITGDVPADQLVGAPGGFRAVATRTFVPAGHIGWAACWLGAARGALSMVLGMIRDPRTRGSFDPSSELLRRRLARARLDLDTVAALLAQAIRDAADATDPEAPAVQLRLNGLKVHAAERCSAVVDELVELTGLRHGYMRDSALPLERVHRDLRSASLNYANDRLYDANGAIALLDRDVTLAWAGRP